MVNRYFSGFAWGRLTALVAMLVCAVAQASPTVSNVRGSQRTDGTGRVDIYYDVAGAKDKMIVSVVLSSNNGTSWNVIPNVGTLTGDTGSGITNGTNKHIVWEAGRDRPDVYWPQTKVKIVAAEIGGTLTVMLPGGVPLELVRIPAGTFLMGSGLDPDWSSTSEAPQHMVSINSDFYMGKYEVTQNQWYAVMGGNPASHQGDINYPVEQVSWNGCKTFITSLNALGQGTFRLPTEAEWEYACRGGTTTRWCFGNDQTLLTKYAWYSVNSGSTTHVVGGKLANPFGLYDIMGNIWEWCEDDYHSTYTGAPTDGSAWIDSPTRGSSRVLRGGAYNSSATYCRSAYRGNNTPSYNHSSRGLRLVRTQ